MVGNSPAHRIAYYNACTAIESKGTYKANGGGHGAKKRTEVQGGKDITVTQSFLRSELLIDPNKTQYNFGILDTQITNNIGALYPTEKRLKQQDVFFTYQLGFYILTEATAGGNPNFQYQLMTFPNPNFFGGVNLDLMVGLWTMGRLNVLVNGEVLTPAWDLMQHHYVPETQIQGPGSSFYNVFNEIDYSKNGLVTVEPNWILNGGNDNQYIINYPQTLANIGISTAKFRLVLMWRGFLAQNASSIMD